ncbi:MAG: RtcB family protein [Deltaproteobacteria bacterium]|nr:RtcB family protein [Deltaproteobacteria bacterium]
MNKKDLKKQTETRWEIPKTYAPFMRVPAVVYATDQTLGELFRDQSLNQLVNVTSLPGIQKMALAMPDAHEGYGFPIGGVAATEFPEGVISPGGIGFDINCGVRLLKSDQTLEEIKPYFEKLAQEIYRQVPSGVGQGGRVKLNSKEMNKVLKEGVKWVIAQGYGKKEDPESIESLGTLPNADPEAVSVHAKKRGGDQLGTMGAGNHFVEVDVVDQIFDEEVAQRFGLFSGQMVVLIHTGSRGLGHQVATDTIRKMVQVMPQYGISLPDQQLACAPFSSPEGRQYFDAMAAAANFAWANRQMITHEVRQAWQNVLKGSGGELSILYDVAHNIAKIEEYDIDGVTKKLIVHRKGATRAFPNQPVIIPGSMGTASYVLVGTEQAMRESFGSCCHGAGRRMSRHQAMKQVRGEALRKDLEKQGIHIQAGSLRGLAEEAPLAYKDVDSVVDIVHKAGIAKKVARLRPLVVIKG